MTEIKDTIISVEPAIPEAVPTVTENQTTEHPSRSNNRGQRGNAGSRGRGDRRSNDRQPQDEFDQKILDIARVTRVMAGGKRMRFRACVAIGDRKGRVAIGLAKGLDVSIAVNKAVNQAKKNLITVPMIDKTIPHEIKQKSDSAIVLLKPAKQGRGIIAGSVVRVILELAGIHNVTSKMLGSHNKINNAKCVIKALRSLKKPMANHRPASKPAVEVKTEAAAE